MSAWDDFCGLYQVPMRFRNPQVNPIADDEAYDDIHGWLQYREDSVLLMGAPGRGKTYATYYIIKRLLEVYRLPSIRFFRSLDVDQRMIEETQQWSTTRHFIDQLFELKFLFLDDFGIECNSERMERNYYDLLDRRWAHNRPTIISTNVDSKDFERIFGSRIASRLQEFMPIEFKKGDLRTL